MTGTLYGAQFFAGRSGTVTASARVVVPVLETILNPMSVLDVGCGQREWLSEFSCEDKVGVDIADWEGNVLHDLTEPLDLERTFDLVLCLETGEHLPEEAADTLVDSLTRHSRTVVFSAAVVGQEGVGHVNCQPHEYWHSKFNVRGYVFNDYIRPAIRERWEVSAWYRDNMFLYLRDR